MKQAIRFLGIVIITALLFSSCNNKHKKKEAEKPQADNSQREVVEFPIKKFSLPYDVSFCSDSNSLIYLKQVPFDTSYLLHLVKHGLQIRGICYVVLPMFHRDLEDFFDETHQLLFFDGLSFKLDSMQWKMIKQKTNDLISSLPDTVSSSPCFDCPSYSVMFDNKKRNTGNNDKRNSFKEYDIFIRDSLLLYFYTKKKSKL
jgi:hypothetical protein